MESRIRKERIDFEDLKKEAKELNATGGRYSIGIEQILMTILLVSLPIGVTQGIYNVVARRVSSTYELVGTLIVICLIQAPFATAFYLNIINMIRNKKIEIKFPITKKTFIITFITQVIAYILADDLRKGNILSITICIGIALLLMIIGAAIIYVTEFKQCSILDGTMIGVSLVIKNIDEFIRLFIVLLPVIILSIVTLGIVLIFEMVYIQTMFFLLIDKLLKGEI